MRANSSPFALLIQAYNFALPAQHLKDGAACTTPTAKPFEVTARKCFDDCDDVCEVVRTRKDWVT